MRQIITKNNILAVIAAVLALMVLVSGVLVCDLLTAVQDNVPSTEFSIDIQAASSLGGSRNGLLCVTPAKLAAAPMTRRLSASASIYDDDQVWSQSTSIELFRMAYDNNAGAVTVRSAYGDKVIAPGTANSYNFYIKNDGATPIDYTVDTTAEVTALIRGQSYTVPLQARFYCSDGDYLLGSPSGLSPMGGLDGLRDEGALSTKHYCRYTLDWLWPFEGDDVFDTLLGNLAAEGDEIRVVVTINVTATGNNASSGGLPQTGDTSNIGLWVTMMVCSLFLLILLLFAYRKEENEEETC